MEKAPGGPKKTINIKLRRQDWEQEDLIRRIHQETTEEEAEEEPNETLQRRPRKRDSDQQGEGSGLETNNTQKSRSTVVKMV